MALVVAAERSVAVPDPRLIFKRTGEARFKERPLPTHILPDRRFNILRSQLRSWLFG